MRIIIHPHARIHGLTDAQIVAAYETGHPGAVIRRRDEGKDPPRWAMIGFDQQGRQIELIAVAAMGGGVIIIHANLPAKGFRDETRRNQR